MALAKKCDRCGVFYNQKNVMFNKQSINGIILTDRKVNNESQFGRMNLDLCPKCLESLVIWLRNEHMTFNEIRQAAGLEPIKESDKTFVQSYSEKENSDD